MAHSNNLRVISRTPDSMLVEMTAADGSIARYNIPQSLYNDFIKGNTDVQTPDVVVKEEFPKSMARFDFTPVPKPKDYDTTIKGLFEAVKDKMTGNDTFFVDPTAPGEVRKYDSNLVDKAKTASSHNRLVRGLDGTWIPLAEAVATKGLGSKMFSAIYGTHSLKPVVSTAGSVLGSYLGAKGFDNLMSATTGKNWENFMYNKLNFTPSMSAWTNLGGIFGEGIADVGQTMLTTYSNPVTAGIRREALGIPYYANMRPSGYKNNSGDIPRSTQFMKFVRDIFVNPFVRVDARNPNYKPNWINDKSDITNFEVFRNDAHRLSMGLDPHKEMVIDNDGKIYEASLYTKKDNDLYDVNGDYIDHVRYNYSNSEAEKNIERLMNNPKERTVTNLRALNKEVPSEGNIVANDATTGNGGFVGYDYNPKDLHTYAELPPFLKERMNRFIGENAPDYVWLSPGTKKTLTDTWDVQPLVDSRSIAPWLTKSLTKVENAHIPVVSKAAHNVKNVELVNLFGGKPFTQQTDLTPWQMYFKLNK